MKTRKNRRSTISPPAARTPLGIEIYQPTTLDSVCKYTVGSVIAAGAAFAAVNLTASPASADEFGGFSDFSGGSLFTGSDFGAGGTFDFSTPSTPGVTYEAPVAIPVSAPDTTQIPTTNTAPVAAPVPEVAPTVSSTPDTSAIVAVIDQSLLSGATTPAVEAPTSGTETFSLATNPAPTQTDSFTPTGGSASDLTGLGFSQPIGESVTSAPTTPAPSTTESAAVQTQQNESNSTSSNVILGVNDTQAGVGGSVALSTTVSNIEESGISATGTPFVAFGPDGTIVPGASASATLPTGTTLGGTLTPAGDTETVSQAVGSNGSVGLTNNIDDQISVNGTFPLTDDGLLKAALDVNTSTGNVGTTLKTPDGSIGYNTDGTIAGSVKVADNLKLSASTGGPGGTSGGIQYSIPLGSGQSESASTPAASEVPLTIDSSGLIVPNNSTVDLFDSASNGTFGSTDQQWMPDSSGLFVPTGSTSSGTTPGAPEGVTPSSLDSGQVKFSEESTILASSIVPDAVVSPYELKQYEAAVEFPAQTGIEDISRAYQPTTAPLPSTLTPVETIQRPTGGSGAVADEAFGQTFETGSVRFGEPGTSIAPENAFTLATPSTKSASGDATTGQATGTDMLGRPSDLLVDNPSFASNFSSEFSVETPQRTSQGTLVASTGNLGDLGIDLLADARTQNDGSKPPVYVPRSDGVPEGPPSTTGDTSVEIYVPPPVSSVIPSNPGSTESPATAGSATGETSPSAVPTTSDVPASDSEGTFDWGPVTFASVGIPFGAFGKVVAGQSQGLPVSVAVGDAAYRSPVAFISDVAVRTALKNPIAVTDNEAVNRLFTSGVGGAVGMGIDQGVKTFYNPIASNIAGREVNAASGLSPATLGVLPVAETAFQVSANALENYFGVCTPGSTDTLTYACNSAISGGITTATWAGGIAQDLKQQEIKRVTQENIDCGCSEDGALTPEQDAQIQANYKKVLRNVGLAVGTQSGVTAAIGAPGKSTVVTETCPTADGSYADCFAPTDGSTPMTPPTTGGDSSGTPPTIPPSAGGGAVKIDGTEQATATSGAVPACATTCRADYETDEKPVDKFDTQVAPSSPVIFDSSFGKAPVWQSDPAARKSPEAPAVLPNTETSWTQMKVPTKVMEQQTGNLFGYPMPVTSQATTATPTPGTSSAPATTWSNVKAPTTPFVIDSSTPTFGEAASQPAKASPAVTTQPTTTQPQKPTMPDPGLAPEEPWIKNTAEFAEQGLKTAGQGLKWVFDNGLWVVVKTGEIGGKVVSPFLGDWMKQP
jgi:hypothetical protein